MKLFGRNASDRPATTDVPPELQPYYESNSPLARLGRGLRRSLPLITLLIIVGAIAVTAGLWWQHRHKPAPKRAPSSQTQTSNQVARNPAQPRVPAGTPGRSSSTPPATRNESPGSTNTTEQAPRSSQPAPKAPGGSAKPATPAPAKPAPAAAAPIPNTGPGDTALVAAAGMALAAAALSYRRQLRRSGVTK